jgi:hypothetical protein
MNAARIRKELRCVAKNRATISYKALGELIRPDLPTLQFARAASPILDGINAEEVDVGRPLLSAVVVRQDSGIPGAGFFKSAREMCSRDDATDQEFWQAEIGRVHDYWSSRRRK